jgi:hypothetical protein
VLLFIRCHVIVALNLGVSWLDYNCSQIAEVVRLWVPSWLLIGFCSYWTLIAPVLNSAGNYWYFLIEMDTMHTSDRMFWPTASKYNKPDCCYWISGIKNSWCPGEWQYVREWLCSLTNSWWKPEIKISRTVDKKHLDMIQPR